MLSGISLPHILLLLVIVVLIFGTGKLKNAGKDLGGFFKGFKEGMKGEEEKPEQPTQQISQQPGSTNTSSTADKKDNV
jgi:sec-independent protein translocase protein TatA